MFLVQQVFVLWILVVFHFCFIWALATLEEAWNLAAHVKWHCAFALPSGYSVKSTGIINQNVLVRQVVVVKSKSFSLGRKNCWEQLDEAVGIAWILRESSFSASLLIGFTSEMVQSCSTSSSRSCSQSLLLVKAPQRI
jgi:hypothetical protein